jgi:hypothetical protein
MENPLSRQAFKRGIKRAIIYYLAGSMLICILHLLVGWDYKYAPPLSFVFLVFLLIIGLLWAVLNITSLPDSRTRPQTLGELTVHVITLVAAAGLITILSKELF